MGLPGFSAPESQFADAWQLAILANDFEIEFMPHDNSDPSKRVEEYPFHIRCGQIYITGVEFRVRSSSGTSQKAPGYGVCLMFPQTAEQHSLLGKIELVLAATGASCVNLMNSRFTLFRSSKTKLELARELSDAMRSLNLSVVLAENPAAAGVVTGQIRRETAVLDGLDIAIGDSFDLNAKTRCSFLALSEPGLARRVVGFFMDAPPFNVNDLPRLVTCLKMIEYSGSSALDA